MLSCSVFTLPNLIPSPSPRTCAEKGAKTKRLAPSLRFYRGEGVWGVRSLPKNVRFIEGKLEGKLEIAKTLKESGVPSIMTKQNNIDSPTPSF